MALTTAKPLILYYQLLLYKKTKRRHILINVKIQYKRE